MRTVTVLSLMGPPDRDDEWRMVRELPHRGGSHDSPSSLLHQLGDQELVNAGQRRGRPLLAVIECESFFCELVKVVQFSGIGQPVLEGHVVPSRSLSPTQLFHA